MTGAAGAGFGLGAGLEGLLFERAIPLRAAFFADLFAGRALRRAVFLRADFLAAFRAGLPLRADFRREAALRIFFLFATVSPPDVWSGIKPGQYIISANPCQDDRSRPCGPAIGARRARRTAS